jgi:hypothetical protein
VTILLPALAVAFAAFCVWLTVRIVNRRERWAKWTLAVVIGLPVPYVASFGPACWLAKRSELTWSRRVAPRIYWPLGWMASEYPGLIYDGIREYAIMGNREMIGVRCHSSDPTTIFFQR